MKTYRPNQHKLKRGQKNRGNSTLLFPMALNFWPVLLFVSQKAFVPIGLILSGIGTNTYRKNIIAAALMIAISLSQLAVQKANNYSAEHWIGYALFILALPILNEAVRKEELKLTRWLAILSVGNALIGLVIFYFQPELSSFRGINRVVGEDGLTHRVYFEATSLIAVFSVSGFRRRWVKLTAMALVLGYLLFLAKSLFVLALWITNRFAPFVLRGRLSVRIALVIILLAVSVGIPNVVIAMRPDIQLSVGMKLMQLEAIVAEGVLEPLGAGWGYVIDDIITSQTQPYQVEMQLPMMLVQVGVMGVLAHAIAILYSIRSVSKTMKVALVRWVVYMAVGLSNPWLFVPSWYLTCILMFSSFEKISAPKKSSSKHLGSGVLLRRANQAESTRIAKI